VIFFDHLEPIVGPKERPVNCLKLLRLGRKWTQGQIAAELNIHPVTYCRAERGWFTRPPAQLDAKLQKVFGEQWTWQELMKAAPMPEPGEEKSQ